MPVAAPPAAGESAAAADVITATDSLESGSTALQAEAALVDTAPPTAGSPHSDESQALADAVPAAHGAPPAGNTAVDLGQISDPCQRLIEERRRLRGVGMDLQGEVSGSRAVAKQVQLFVQYKAGRACLGLLVQHA